MKEITVVTMVGKAATSHVSSRLSSTQRQPPVGAARRLPLHSCQQSHTRMKTIFHSLFLTLFRNQWVSSRTSRDVSGSAHHVRSQHLYHHRLNLCVRTSKGAGEVKGGCLHRDPRIRTLAQRELLGEPNSPELASSAYRGLGPHSGLLTSSPQIY